MPGRPVLDYTRGARVVDVLGVCGGDVLRIGEGVVERDVLGMRCRQVLERIRGDGGIDVLGVRGGDVLGVCSSIVELDVRGMHSGQVLLG